MTSKGSRNDRGDAAAASDGVIAEPSEARLRNFLLTAALLVVPIVLAALYFRIMFPGLTNPDALDLAQLGRNMRSGRGFVTNILLPYAMPSGAEPVNLTRQPELLHGPAYPFVLALAFGALGTKDAVPAWVSALFYVLTVPVLYVLGTRVFNR
ncbi:MAG TPA: hypothetical protein VK689_13340, partial [Armatimonadota bacterium]|nr:hypothetical protein [Armatimonadota bacterium]